MLFLSEEDKFVDNLSGIGGKDKCKERLDATAISDICFIYLVREILFSSGRLSGNFENDVWSSHVLGQKECFWNAISSRL